MSKHLIRSKFQFHKGTIRTLNLASFQRHVYQFQFHKGTIRTSNREHSLIQHIYFNSIKVQLEPVCAHRWAVPGAFQFHKGTIRTYGIYVEGKLEKIFQFHKGTIRTWLHHTPSLCCRISIP